MANQVMVARSSSLIDSSPEYRTLGIKSAAEPLLNARRHLRIAAGADQINDLTPELRQVGWVSWT